MKTDNSGKHYLTPCPLHIISSKAEPRREAISSRGGRVGVYLHLRVLTNAVLGDVIPLGVNHLVRKVLQL